MTEIFCLVPPEFKKAFVLKKSLLLLASVIAISSAFAQQQETHDYSKSNRDIIRHGVQAVLMCNGLFTSNRTLEQVLIRNWHIQDTRSALHREELIRSIGNGKQWPSAPPAEHQLCVPPFVKDSAA